MAKSEKKNSGRQSFWRAVFNQSRVNGAPYRGEYLPAHSWIWPRGTFLQRRLRSLRAQDNLSSEGAAEDEMASVFERIDRAASARLRLVPDPASVASEPDVGEPVREVPRDRLTLALNRAEHAKPSPTQALLGLEREGWARVSNGAMQRVEVDEKSVQAALRKENMEKFQQTLVQSGQWVRSASGPLTPEPSQAVNPEPVAASQKNAGSAADRSLETAAKPAAVQAPVTAAAPAATSMTGAKPAPAAAPMAPADRTGAKPTVDQPARTSAAQPVPGWDDIDDKLLWLAKPSN